MSTEKKDEAAPRLRAPRNRTLTLDDAQRRELEKQLLIPDGPLDLSQLCNRIINGDLFETVRYLPDSFVDLMIIDPPYNLNKNFRNTSFSEMSDSGYREYLESWFPSLMRLLKPGATVYMCGDWKCSAAEYEVMSKYLTVRNRISWQREKGRGAAANWKNCCEDIWFATAGKDYYFNAEAVRMKRRVIAPYRTPGGIPKDWTEDENGRYRITSASNFWDDISIPYWSMPENTDHPTQKPEKLMAKLILASSRVGEMVFDPFSGSGTVPVTARKLDRNYCGIDIEKEYCCYAAARLAAAENDRKIQGYTDGVFWERNSLPEQRKKSQSK